MLTRKRKLTVEVDQPAAQITEVEKQPELPCHPSPIKRPATCIATSTELLTNSTNSRFANDIGNFVNPVSPLTQQQKYHLLCNVWKPEPEYRFPMNARGRRFQHQWSMKFPWLIYSEILDGAFCINCLLFGGESTHNASKLKKLYKAPLTTWSTALQNFREHVEKSPIHHTATILASQFKLLMQQKATSIDVQLDSIWKKQIQKNRERLRSIVDAIILCGRQNIPLRGHRDDSKYLLDSSLNPENF